MDPCGVVGELRLRNSFVGDISKDTLAGVSDGMRLPLMLHIILGSIDFRRR